LVRQTADDQQVLKPPAHEARDWAVKLIHHWQKFTPEYLPKALQSFQTAVALDPNYALAHVGLADFFNWAGIYGILPPQECHSRARAASLRALELDDTLGEAYAALALTSESSELNWPETERLYQRALELNPNYSLAHEWYSSLLVASGRFEEGAREIRRAEELDPHSLRAMTLTSWTTYQARLFPEATAKANQIIDLDRNYPQGYIQLGNCLEQMGRAEEATARAEEIRTAHARLGAAEIRALLRPGDRGAADRSARGSQPNQRYCRHAVRQAVLSGNGLCRARRA
jgi:tetratricopeptide (TPR) repeat protein